MKNLYKKPISKAVRNSSCSSAFKLAVVILFFTIINHSFAGDTVKTEPVSTRMPIIFGPSYGANMYKSTNTYYGHNEFIDAYSGYSSSREGIFTGFVYELPLGKPETSPTPIDVESDGPNQALTISLIFDSKDIRFAKDVNLSNTGLLNSNESAEHSIRHNMLYINIGADYFYRIIGRLHMGFGLSAGIKKYTNSYEYFKIKSDDPEKAFNIVPGYRYDDSGKTMVLHNGDNPEFNSLLLKTRLSLRYDLLIWEVMDLVPEVSYIFNINPIVKNTDWRMHNFFAGMTARFGL